MTAQPPSLFDEAEAADVDAIVAAAAELFARLEGFDDNTRMDAVNRIRQELHQHSPMRGEPVDCVLWVDAETVQGNEYNPNVVAPPEMRLLRKSILADGFTQPIVAWPVEAGYEVVDGFHRHKIGKEDKKIRQRIGGRLPVAVINSDRTALTDRMAATVRHNEARGKHTISGQVDLVLLAFRSGKTEEWICQEFGMDPDQVLRLLQTTSIAEANADGIFSEGWEPDSFVIPAEWSFED